MGEAPNDFKSAQISARTTFADRCLQSLLLLNGGAAGAILTYAGSEKQALTDLKSSLQFFAYAPAFAVMTTFLAYITQIFFAEYSDESINRVGRPVRLLAMATGFVSLCCFLRGIALVP